METGQSSGSLAPANPGKLANALGACDFGAAFIPTRSLGQGPSEVRQDWTHGAEPPSEWSDALLFIDMMTPSTPIAHAPTHQAQSGHRH